MMTPFFLDTDASGATIGIPASQFQDGEERLVALVSRVLSPHERNYYVTRRELLAIVFLDKMFHQYLLGRHLTLRTDQSALQWFLRTPEPIGQQARWCEILEEFDFSIIHRNGR